VTARGSTFAVPADDHRAAEIAMRDAKEARALWRRHGQARQLLARRMMALQARHLEDQVIRTGDTLIARAVAREARA